MHDRMACGWCRGCLDDGVGVVYVAQTMHVDLNVTNVAGSFTGSMVLTSGRGGVGPCAANPNMGHKGHTKSTHREFYVKNFSLQRSHSLNVLVNTLAYQERVLDLCNSCEPEVQTIDHQ